VSRTVAVAALVVVVSLVGCAPVATFRTARTVEAGTWEVGVGGGVLRVPRNLNTSCGDHPCDSPAFPIAIPQVEVIARGGVNDFVDIGARLSVIGGELETGIGFHAGPFAASIAPSVGARRLWDSTDLDAQLPVLVGLDLIPGKPRLLELTLGGLGRLEYELWKDGDPTELALYVGGSAGLSSQLSRRFYLRLEFDFLRPVYNSAPPFPVGSSRATDSLHSDLWQFAVAGGWKIW
jgi:hypothetical protein